VCGAAADRAKTLAPARGMTNAAFSGMKPVLLLAFLALGPALAQQFPVVPNLAPGISGALAQRSGTTPQAAPREAERIWLCGR
jgi:hypothetical protein